MRTAVVGLAASVAVVSATPGAIPSDVLINCAKPNANYCMSGDIILRCDVNGIGTRGRCSANVAGYPPAGGVATCFQSSEEAGDAACQKNCVVYAAQPFTLPADKCTPSATVRTTQSGSQTGILTIPEGTSLGSATVPTTTETGIITIPEGTGTPSAPSTTGNKLTNSMRISTASSSHSENDDCPAPTVKPTTTASNQPTTTKAAATTGSSSTPTAAANINQAAGILAAAGFVAALFL